MSKKKLKRLRCVMSLMLAAVMLLGMPCSEVLAAEEIITIDENVVEVEAQPITFVVEAGIHARATTFTRANISVSFSSEGMLAVFYTCMNKTASVVGVKDIKIQKKVWYGWTTVLTSTGYESQNYLSSACQVLYTGAEKGETYRVSCTHYANVDGYRELANETEGYLCSY